MSQINYKLPVITLRGTSVLPDMILHFDVSRPRSVAALEAAMREEQNILLITQMNAEDDEPDKEALYKIGTIAKVKQLVKMPKDTIRVLVEGKLRARLDDFLEWDPYILGEVTIMEDEDENDELKEEAMLRYLQKLFEKYTAFNAQLSPELVKQMESIDRLDKFVSQLCNNMPMEYIERQQLLEAGSLGERFELLSAFIIKETEVIRINREIQAKVKQKVDQNQKEYVLREQLKVIREELGENTTLDDAEDFEKALEILEASDSVKERIQKEIDRFRNSINNSAENGVIRGFLETVLELPWDKMSEDNTDISKAEAILQADHYGLEKVKQRMIEYLAVRILTKKGDAPILCLVGPPGTGKTSIGRSVARALNKKYVRISLGGVHDEAEIRGHRKTYIGAMPGRIAMALKQSGVKNPVILFDEIDKVGNDYKGDPFAALLEVLDSEQNCKFRDNYIEIPIDLSEVLFIATANSTSGIPRPLLDRMEVIEINSYTANEKYHIAKRHLIPKQVERHGLTKAQLRLNDLAIEKIITNYTREAGVRQLERRIGDVCRKGVRQILQKNKRSIRITEKNIDKFLGKPKYNSAMANEKDEVGIARGLAWTSVGGETLSVEVNVLPGKGRFELTGKLGDVMKESARAGISYLRSIISGQGISKEFFENNDIHIHIPEGAVPKDGPSAGITMATAMYSAITEKSVKANVAMTGEITLRGRVLPVGGLKEKILAAKMAGIKSVIVPDENRRDIDELETEIVEGLNIVYAKTMEDVWPIALNA